MSSSNKENAKLIHAVRDYGEKHVKAALLERAFGENGLPPSLERELILNIGLDYGVAYIGTKDIRVRYSLRSEIPFVSSGLESYTATLEVPTCFFKPWNPEEEQ